MSHSYSKFIRIAIRLRPEGTIKCLAADGVTWTSPDLPKSELFKGGVNAAQAKDLLRQHYQTAQELSVPESTESLGLLMPSGKFHPVLNAPEYVAPRSTPKPKPVTEPAFAVVSRVWRPFAGVWRESQIWEGPSMSDAESVYLSQVAHGGSVAQASVFVRNTHTDTYYRMKRVKHTNADGLTSYRYERAIVDPETGLEVRPKKVRRKSGDRSVPQSL